MRKKALITGITGQDGSYLAEYLVEKGYEVAGLVRRNSNPNVSRISPNVLPKIRFFHGDMTDITSLEQAITYFEPTEVYNLAAQSFVGLSWQSPFYTTEVDGVGVLNILSILQRVSPDCKFYQASTSEMFGQVKEIPQKETTPFHPRSPYGVAKLFAHWTTINYRESYNMFACSGILFNHESERRGLEFVTRKITNKVAQIMLGIDSSPLVLGNLEAKRDWGYAPEYVDAMYKMMNHHSPDDYVIATGQLYTVEEFVKKAFAVAGFDIKFHGNGVERFGYNTKNNEKLVTVSREFYRPAEVELLVGDSSKAKRVLGWSSTSSLDTIVEKMVDYDIEYTRGLFKL